MSSTPLLEVWTPMNTVETISCAAVGTFRMLTFAHGRSSVYTCYKLNPLFKSHHTVNGNGVRTANLVDHLRRQSLYKVCLGSEVTLDGVHFLSFGIRVERDSCAEFSAD